VFIHADQIALLQWLSRILPILLYTFISTIHFWLDFGGRKTEE